ncbi:sensor histidine kinase [Paenibacillus koleovorans]|uniref:sensor histidine kinase n=1 Tax=Paenibacillus koleovorans TaxID=121608 RepID=UPI000FD7EFB8|nr:histidine kinase [Paenibacillus koleovorans]
MKTAEENFTNVISGNLVQTSNALQNLLEETEKQAAFLSYNFQLQDALRRENGSVADQYDDYLVAQRALDAIEKTYGLKVKLYLDRPRRFLNDGIRYLDQAELTASRLNALQPSNRSGSGWFYAFKPGEGLTLSCLVEIVSVRDFTHLATATVSLNEELVRRVSSQAASSLIHRWFLITENGIAISSSSPELLDQPVLPPDWTKRRAEGQNGVMQNSTSENHLTVYEKLPSFPLFVLAEIPMSEMTNRAQAIVRNFLWVAAAILSLSFLVAYIVSTGVTRRIRKLVEAMGAVEKNDFKIRVHTDYLDEVGILSGKFNWMVERIRALIQDVYKTDLEKKEAELNLLQAQINPHFLYNTLNGIHWMAVRHEAPEISAMVRNLSDFLRLSLNISRRTSIATELEHVRAYFAIQRIRFNERIRLVIDVEPELLACSTLALILQPLVENALLHGILPDEDRIGTIAIRGELQDGLVMLEVSDDGRGMTEARLSKLTTALRSDDPTSIGNGLRNVHQRIRFQFGKEYGLDLLSGLGEGTTCILIFPATYESV